MDLTDEQWLHLEPLFLPSRPAFDPGSSCRRPLIIRRAGRPRLPPRPLLDGIFWKLRSARPWYDLPARYPAWQTCYARHRLWQASGLLDRACAALYSDLRSRGGLDLLPYLPAGALAFLKFGFGRRLPPDSPWETVWQLSTALLLFAALAEKARARAPLSWLPQGAGRGAGGEEVTACRGPGSG